MHVCPRELCPHVTVSTQVCGCVHAYLCPHESVSTLVYIHKWLWLCPHVSVSMQVCVHTGLSLCVQWMQTWQRTDSASFKVARRDARLISLSKYPVSPKGNTIYITRETNTINLTLNNKRKKVSSILLWD